MGVKIPKGVNAERFIVLMFRFVCSSSHVSNTEVSDQKAESSSLGSNLPMSTESEYLSESFCSQCVCSPHFCH